MKKKITVSLMMLLVFGCASQGDVNTSALESKITTVVTQLDNAKYTQYGSWNYDWGMSDVTGIYITFEYLRSLVSYADLQAVVSMPIFSSGPHSRTHLNLIEAYQFGHYNPKFVRLFYAAISHLSHNHRLISSTREPMTQYGILKKLQQLQEIYHYIQNNHAEFISFRKRYQKMLADKNWPQGGYRDYLPENLDDLYYANWAETDYYFWIRRNIDGTDAEWIKTINTILSAYG